MQVVLDVVLPVQLEFDILRFTLLPRIQVHALIYVAEAKVHALKKNPKCILSIYHCDEVTGYNILEIADLVGAYMN